MQKHAVRSRLGNAQDERPLNYRIKGSEHYSMPIGLESAMIHKATMLP